MIEYARLSPGPGFSATNALLYYAQRLVTPALLRRTVSRSIAAVVRSAHGTGQHWEADPTCGEVVAKLNCHGFATLDAFPTDTVDEICDFFRSHEVLGPNNSLTSLARLPPATANAAYPLATILACKPVLAIVNSPRFLRIAAEYIGCKPTLTSIGVRWSFPVPGRPVSVQTFHRDPDDWRFLKLFVYLTDVDSESGPHVYVLTSHKTAGSLRSRSFDGSKVEREYGAKNVMPVLGPRGTTFIADTYGIHMGVPPRQRPRLILQVQYSLLPNFALRYDPVSLPDRESVDPYVNRLMLAEQPYGRGTG